MDRMDETARLRARYLDLIEDVLVNRIYRDPPQQVKRWRRLPFVRANREIGRDLPSQAHTMIGHERMRNLRSCLETAIAQGVPGDVIETGVWRGGACIYMAAILDAWGETARRVWVADSFAGLPRPDARH